MNACLFCRLQIKRELFFLVLLLAIHLTAEFYGQVGMVVILECIISIHDFLVFFQLGLEASFDIGFRCAQNGVNMEWLDVMRIGSHRIQKCILDHMIRLSWIEHPLQKYAVCILLSVYSFIEV